MNNEQIKSDLLINEWQLGSQLNQAVANGTRCKFNLLLSLLSDDARDFAQFSFKAKEEANLVQAELRSLFFLPKTQPLINKGISLTQAKRLNEDLLNLQLSSIRLHQLLSNEALLSRHERNEFPADVVENLSLVAQHRLSQNHINTDVAKGIDFSLMKQYQQLDLESRPLQITYM